MRNFKWSYKVRYGVSDNYWRWYATSNVCSLLLILPFGICLSGENTPKERFFLVLWWCWFFEICFIEEKTPEVMFCSLQMIWALWDIFYFMISSSFLFPLLFFDLFIRLYPKKKSEKVVGERNDEYLIIIGDHTPQVMFVRFC